MAPIAAQRNWMIAVGSDSAYDQTTWPECPYRIRLATRAELEQPPGPKTLFSVIYGDARTGVVSADPRQVSVALPCLHGTRAGEIWESRLPVMTDRSGAVSLAENGEVMMIRLTLPESALAEDTEAAAARLYDELLRRTQQRGYPHLLRVWNFISGINHGEGQAERYRQFNAGRHRVLSQRPLFENSLPAATAIGTRMPAGAIVTPALATPTTAGGITIMALAGKRAGQPVENPRQLAAFRYPRAYGTRSPSFSRAMLLPWADGSQLMVSGTASIVGHASEHPGDPQAQLKQTAVNMQTLLSQPGLSRRGFLPEQYTLYLRNPEDLLPVQPLLPKLFGGAPIQVLQGDICRRELLLEVEAIYRLPRSGSR